MTDQEIRQYFEQGEPDQDDTITIGAMRQILYNYAKKFNIELQIQEHLPSANRVRFETFKDYFLRNTTDSPLVAYHSSGQLRWRSNLQATPTEDPVTPIELPTEMAPPSEEEQAVSMEMALSVLEELQRADGQVTFADFLRFHNPDGDELRSLNLKI